MWKKKKRQEPLNPLQKKNLGKNEKKRETGTNIPLAIVRGNGTPPLPAKVERKKKLGDKKKEKEKGGKRGERGLELFL